MRVLYLDCGMGAAGDMLAAALYELLDDEKKREFLDVMNGLGLEGVSVEARSSEKCGITGTHMAVMIKGEEEGPGRDDSCAKSDGHGHESHGHCHGSEPHDHHHHHSGAADIRAVIDALPVSEKVRNDAAAVYELIAEAESAVHGVPVTDIHFHEVGTLDAVADVTAVCLLMEMLAPERVCASPVHVGSGSVTCAHGVLPVPAPATAHLLRGIPMYGGSVRGELTTPTGAALLKYFVDSFGDMPVIRADRIGYGMGTKDFETANCLRAVIGSTSPSAGSVIELTCNVDDMTGERIGFAMERLFEAGALEVYTVPVGMKKSRPGTMLCVMCTEALREEMVGLIFRHTTTLGVRESVSRRYTLRRSTRVAQTPLGAVREKISEGYGVTRRKYEYEDLAAIAAAKGLSIEEVIEAITKE